MKDIPFAVTSTQYVSVDACEYVPDAYEALKEAEEKEPETKIAYVENENIYIEPISRSLMNDINMNS